MTTDERILLTMTDLAASFWRTLRLHDRLIVNRDIPLDRRHRLCAKLWKRCIRITVKQGNAQS